MLMKMDDKDLKLIFSPPEGLLCSYHFALSRQSQQRDNSLTPRLRLTPQMGSSFAGDIIKKR